MVDIRENENKWNKSCHSKNWGKKIWKDKSTYNKKEAFE
jgi:hypothetical protein